MEQFLEYSIVIWDLKNNPNTTNEAHVIFLKKSNILIYKDLFPHEHLLSSHQYWLCSSTTAN